MGNMKYYVFDKTKRRKDKGRILHNYVNFAEWAGLQRKRQLIFTVKHFIDNDRVDRWKNESINIFRRLRQKNR